MVESDSEKLISILVEITNIGVVRPEVIERANGVMEVLNTYVRSIADEIGIILHPYAIINHSVRERYEVRRGWSETVNRYNLNFNIDDFRDKELLAALMAHQILFQLFEKKFPPLHAENWSIAVIWDILPKERRRQFQVFWRERNRSYFRGRMRLAITLYNFVRTRSKIYPRRFSSDMIASYLSLDKEHVDENFPFFRSKLDFSKLTEADIRVWDGLINNRYDKFKELAQQLELSEVTVTNSRQKLEHLFFTMKSAWFVPSYFGLRSYFLIIRSDRELDVKGWTFPIRLGYYELRADTHMYIVHFLSTGRRERLEKWVKTVGEVLELQFPPVLGEENEGKRFVSMRPELYKLDERRWEVGEARKIWHYPSETEWKRASHLEREILLAMLERRFSKEEIVERVGGNRKKLYATINGLRSKGVVWPQVEMTFFTNMYRVGVIIKGRHYGVFIDRYCARLPYAKVWSFETSEEEICVALLGLPAHRARAIIQGILTNIPESKVLHLVSLPHQVEEINIKAVRERWRGRATPIHSEK